MGGGGVALLFQGWLYMYLSIFHSATACPRAALLLEGKIAYSSVEEEGMFVLF